MTHLFEGIMNFLFISGHNNILVKMQDYTNFYE